MRLCAWLLLFALCSPLAVAQTDGESYAVPPNGVDAGPFGVPQLVLDESGNWTYPLEVYSSSDVRYYVPDITSPGWVQWHAEEYRQSGAYTTLIYAYAVKTRSTSQAVLSVDTRKKTAVLSHPMAGVIRRLSLSDSKSQLAKAINKISAIVADDNAQFHGMTAGEALEEQRRAVSNMVPH